MGKLVEYVAVKTFSINGSVVRKDSKLLCEGFGNMVHLTQVRTIEKYIKNVDFAQLVDKGYIKSNRS